MKRKNEKALLPTMPIDNVVIEPWWLVKVSLITDEDVKVYTSRLHFFSFLKLRFTSESILL